MNLAELIAALQGGANPNTAIVNAASPAPGLPSDTASAQASMPPIPPSQTVPQGVPTPVTNPTPQAATPQAYQSPPDLANMYVKLMQDSQNAAHLDKGLTLIAAGLSNSPTNRAALIQGAMGGHAGGMSLSASDLINFQKQADAQRQQIILEKALPALTKQYGLTDSQAKALVASGQFGEVLKHYSTENLGHVEDKETGQEIFFNQRTGKEITRVGSEKSDPTQYVAGPNGMELRNTRTGELVGPQGVGLPPDKLLVTMPDGSQQVVDKNAVPTGAVVGPAAKPGDVIDPLQNQLNAINKENAAAGKPLMTMPDLIKLKQSPGVQVNVSPSGATFPTPEAGFAYLRNADNTVKVDADGKPTLYRVAGGSAEAEAAAAAQKKTEADVKKGKSDVQNIFTASNVGEAVKNAMQHVDTPGVVGVGSNLTRGVPMQPGGMPWDKYDAAVKTIGSNITIDTLARMRQASPTGGALGNVSDFEDKMLQSVITPLSTATDAATARKSLIRVQAAMELLANDNFNHDPAKFLSALDNRVGELKDQYAPKTPSQSKIRVERIQ